MRAALITIAVTLLSAAAGTFLVLVLLNRRLILMPDDAQKLRVILVTFGLVAGAFVAAALALPPMPWAVVPIGVLAGLFLLELRRVALRRLHAGSRPVDTVPHAVEYLRPVTTTDIVTHRYEVVLPDWRGPAFRVTHLSDFHVTPRLPARYYLRAVDLADETRADFVFITGDFVTRLEAAGALDGILRPLGRRGTYAVLGNHDYWEGADEVRRLVRASGITLLTDELVSVSVDGAVLEIAGCDHPWGAGDCALPRPGDGVVRLVLSHTPDNIYRLSRQGAHCVFSGHFHAGQIRLPVVGPVVIPSAYGRRFDHGHFVIDGTHLFVVSGVGAARPPLRIYCQPDIFVVDIRGASCAASADPSTARP